MNKIIAFSKFNTTGLIISLFVTSILIGITVYRGGFNLGIDFRSGQSVEVSIPSVSNADNIQTAIAGDFPRAVITPVGNATKRTFSIKISSTEKDQAKRIASLRRVLAKEYPSMEILGSSFIGATLSKSLFRSAITLTLLALVLIMLYVALRFKFRFSLAAIVALVHDTVFVLGFIGAFQIEVTVSTVAAVLTIVGYSLNDTIVIFDRIRESANLMKGASFTEITDTGITRTLSRTIITSFTTILAVAAIYFFARGDIQNFARVLLLGLVEGAWSSVFIATPMLYVFGVQKIFMKSKKGNIIADKNVRQISNTSQVTKSVVVAPSNETISSTDVDKIRAEILIQKKKRKHKKK